MDWNERIQAMDEAAWKKVNIAGGIVLGLVVGAVLFFLSDYAEFGPYAFMGAVVLALFVPRFVQSRVDRSVHVGQIAMLFTLAACMGVYIVYPLLMK